MNNQIINSLLDVDFYKLTMLQWITEYFPKEHARFAFTNRTRRVKLGRKINLTELREQIAAVQNLSFRDDELGYLASMPVFKKEFVDKLRKFSLSPVEVDVDHEGNLVINAEGLWSEATLWETIILSIVNELYFQFACSYMNQTQMAGIYQRGEVNLLQKIRILKIFPEIRFSEFGTRRRFSRTWQEFVARVLAEKIPEELVGTSNVALARKFGIQPIGTLAHELFMGLYAIRYGNADAMRASHNEVLALWRNLYGNELSIALTDTYGTDFFFKDMTEEQARQWAGLRQDSGDPQVFGENAIRFYEKYGIDPKEKMIVWSDGLDVETIVRLYVYFRGRVKPFFGWGTNLTNDLGYPALSLVMKLVSANGNGAVKLSDNIAKAIGNREDVAYAKRLFGYTEVFNKQPVY